MESPKAIASSATADEPEKIVAWFHRILRNTLTDEFRKARSQEKKLNEYAVEILPRLDPETETDLCRCVSSLLEELHESEKKILEGHFFEGKKFKELSVEFRQTEGAIRVKALRAREKLKESLRACCNITRFEEAKDCGC